MGDVDRYKLVTTFLLAAWPSFAASGLVTALVEGKAIPAHSYWWALGITIGSALYQGLFAVNRQLSNPNRDKEPKE